MTETPFELGFRMPAEWEQHEATWLSWPTDPTTWPDRVPQAEQVYVQMIAALHSKEKVHVLIDTEKEVARIQKMLEAADAFSENVLLHAVKSIDSWIRDYGPIFIKNDKEVAFTKWRFNSWGEKYEELLDDDKVVDRIMPYLKGVQRFDTGLVLEGGSIDSNGLGTCLTTEQCLLNKNRNPQLSKEQIEEKLRDYLGFTNIIWLGEGIAGDDTDGHVDDFARFTSKDTVLCATEENTEDENHAVLQENYEKLQGVVDQDGKKLNVHAIPMPAPKYASDRRLAASYLNFYIGNNVVLLPTYQDANDDQAIQALKKAFPKRDVVPIDCSDFIWGYGALHCVTQQEPTI